jgi:hypothetical protein
MGLRNGRWVCQAVPDYGGVEADVDFFARREVGFRGRFTLVPERPLPV